MTAIQRTPSSAAGHAVTTGKLSAREEKHVRQAAVVSSQDDRLGIGPNSLVGLDIRRLLGCRNCLAIHAAASAPSAPRSNFLAGSGCRWPDIRRLANIASDPASASPRSTYAGASIPPRKEGV